MRMGFNPRDDMQPPTIFMRNALSKIKLHCALQGCAKIVTYNNLTTHIAECSFNSDTEATCKYYNQLYKKCDETEHILSCTQWTEQMVFDCLRNHSPISKDREHRLRKLTDKNTTKRGNLP